MSQKMLQKVNREMRPTDFSHTTTRFPLTLTALGVTVVLLGRRMNWPLALCAGAAAFVLCFALLTALMAYVRRRQREQADTFEDE